MLASIPQFFNALFPAGAPKDTVAGPLDHRTHCRTLADTELIDSLVKATPQLPFRVYGAPSASFVPEEAVLAQTVDVQASWEARLADKAKRERAYHQRWSYDSQWDNSQYGQDEEEHHSSEGDSGSSSEGEGQRTPEPDCEPIDAEQARKDALFAEMYAAHMIQDNRATALIDLTRPRYVESVIWDVALYNSIARWLGDRQMPSSASMWTWDDVKEWKAEEDARDQEDAEAEAEEQRRAARRSRRSGGIYSM